MRIASKLTSAWSTISLLGAIRGSRECVDIVPISSPRTLPVTGTQVASSLPTSTTSSNYGAHCKQELLRGINKVALRTHRKEQFG